MPLANEFYAGTQGGAVSPTQLQVARGITAGGPYMAQLGDYQFSLETAAFEELQRQTAYRWQAQDRIGRMPAQQFLGPGADTIELQGTIYPHFRGGLGQLAQMRAAAGGGKPLALTYAFERVGQYVGLWCITSVRDNRSVFFRDGPARKIDFSVSLVAYGEDATELSTVATAAQAAAAVDGALAPPPLTRSAASALTSNAVAVAALPTITAASPATQVQAAANAVAGATNGAAVMSGLMSATVQRALSSVITGRVPSMSTVLGDIMRVATTHDIINRDTLAAIQLVSTSRGDVQAIARSAEILLRQSAMQASAATGRVEGVYAAGTGDVLSDASLGNVVRAGMGIVHAGNEAARQLNQIIGRIEL